MQHQLAARTRKHDCIRDVSIYEDWAQIKPQTISYND